MPVKQNRVALVYKALFRIVRRVEGDIVIRLKFRFKDSAPK
jgi:hypothetical protein